MFTSIVATASAASSSTKTAITVARPPPYEAPPPPPPLPPLGKRLWLKLKGARSEGRSTRHDRGLITDDADLSKLIADERYFRQRAKTARAEVILLEQELSLSKSSQHLAIRDARKAVATNLVVPDLSSRTTTWASPSPG